MWKKESKKQAGLVPKEISALTIEDVLDRLLSYHDRCD